MATSKNTRQPTGHIAPFGLRLQPELKARLEREAEKAGRSLNAELVARLERSLEGSLGAASTGVAFSAEIKDLVTPWTQEQRDRFADALTDKITSSILAKLSPSSEQAVADALDIPPTRRMKIRKD